LKLRCVYPGSAAGVDNGKSFGIVPILKSHATITIMMLGKTKVLPNIMIVSIFFRQGIISG